MNVSMIIALVGLWLSGFCVGLVLEKIRNRKRGVVMVHMQMSKEDMKEMVDDAVVNIKAKFVPKEHVVNMIKRMQVDVLNMQSDRMSGDTDLIRRNEMLDILGKYIVEVREK